MVPSASPYALFRVEDWDSDVACPIGMGQCLRIQPQKRPSIQNIQKKKQWEFLEEGSLRSSCSACVFMTSQYFDYYWDVHWRTFLACLIRKRLIPDGEHLTRKCLL